ncbi:MAG: dihydrodipicolinate synthase family protein, partial [Oscillospiraceae bacterium]|nr:dihydrodipicolinate synthase family protein [Oscillospiraceae bacterium]
QLKIMDIVDAMFCEVNPIPVKTALNLMGKNVGPLRLPLVPPSPENLDKIKTELQKWNLI